MEQLLSLLLDILANFQSYVNASNLEMAKKMFSWLICTFWMMFGIWFTQSSDCFQWSNSTILPYLISSKYPEETLHRNLKERIYYDIISYFDQGKVSCKNGILKIAVWNLNEYSQILVTLSQHKMRFRSILIIFIRVFIYIYII